VRYPERHGQIVVPAGDVPLLAWLAAVATVLAAAGLLLLPLSVGILGWRFRIRTDSVEGRGAIRADSQQARRESFAVFYSLYGNFDPIKMDSGFGRIRWRVGFGQIRTDSWTPNMEVTNPGSDRHRHPLLAAVEF